MEEKLSISELLSYYITRYGLSTENRSSLNEKADDGMRTYNAAISRIIQSVQVGEITLWDAIKPAEGVRRISIAEFEKHCFSQWAKYIEKNCGQYNAGALETDRERLRLYEEDAFWADRAREADEVRDKAFETGYVPGISLEDFDSYVSARKRGHEMMLEAVYEALYDGFDWEKLQQDTELADSYSGNYGDETPGDVMKARYRLQSFLNYVGKRRT